MTSKGCAFLMDMGTGKTITTIALAGTLHHKHKITQMLVVCPKSIVDVWEQEFEKFADFPYQLAVLDGTSAKKADTIRYMIGNGLQIIVVNYESCWRLEAELTRWHPDMIVCDESSKIKNPQAKCSKALHRLGKISSYNLILTGTPITNSPLDFFSQYKFLDESIFGGSFYGFRAYYAILGGFQNHQIVGYKHLAELVEKAHSIAYRIRIDEAVDLPEFVEEVRPVKLEQNAQKVYDGIEKDSFAELMNGEITTRNVLTQLLRLSQITGGFVRNDDGDDTQQLSTAKLDALEDVIDSCMEEGKKVIVFARFVPEIEAISRMLRKKNIGYALIKGDVKDRAEQVSTFQTDPDTKVFVGQLQTTGMGLTLTAGSVCVYYSLDFSYANYQQSMARVRRIGQTKRGVYIHLVCKDTIDEKVMGALKQKADVSKLLVDDYKKSSEDNDMNEKSMLAAADTLKALRDEKSDLQAKLKDVQERIDAVEAELIQLMTDEECTGFDRNGSRFSLVIREFPGAVPEEKEELYRRMRVHGFDHLFTINTMTLGATVKELKANNDDVLPDWLEGVIQVFEQPSIRVSKSKK